MLCHYFLELESFFPFSCETLDCRCRYTFVITHINAITFFLRILNGKPAFTHFSPQSLSIVLTQLNRWCANLFDMIVCNGRISSFMINPNGLYSHVPSHATEFELALALIFKTGSTLLVHHWQPGGLVLDNHCSYDRHCQYKSPFTFMRFMARVNKT